MSIFEALEGFLWDKANQSKNLDKHNITIKECEEVFLSKKYILFDDIKHSYKERRFIIFGKTVVDKQLTIIFVIRNKQVRVISARPASRKEREIYEKTLNRSKI